MLECSKVQNMLIKLIKYLKSKNKYKNNIQQISLNLIKSNPYQPRRDFDDKSMDELISSIKAKGVLTPVILRKSGNDYEIVSGERRVRACRKLKFKTIPSIIGNFTDGEMLEIALLENLQRKDLTILEEALSYSHIYRFFNPQTQEEFAEEVGKRIGRDAKDVYEKLNILSLPPILRESINLGIINFEQAKILKNLPEKDTQIKAIDKIKNEKLNLIQTERLVNKILKNKSLDKNQIEKENAVILFKQLIENSIYALEDVGINVEKEYKEYEDGLKLNIDLKI
jgi:ParB family chromosome partitioning protein